LIEKTPKMSAVKTAQSPASVVDENSAGSEIDATAGEEAVKEVEKSDALESDDKVEKESKVEKAEVAAAVSVSVKDAKEKEETVDCNNLSLLLPVEGVPISALEFPPKIHDTEGDKAVEVSDLSCLPIRLVLSCLPICQVIFLSDCISRVVSSHSPNYFSPSFLLSHFPPFPPSLPNTTQHTKSRNRRNLSHPIKCRHSHHTHALALPQTLPPL
jgi:hypothetical protein